jgi:hypothetical protein
MNRTLLMISLLCIFPACQKNDEQPEHQTNRQKVVFAASRTIPDAGLRSAEDWECKPYEPDYAHITISDTDYFPRLYRIDGMLYTQYILLEIPNGAFTATYVVSNFLLYDDGGTAGGTLEADDTIVMGIPRDTSAYAGYVSTTLDFSFDVNVFQGLQVPVEVLCFQTNSAKKQYSGH